MKKITIVGGGTAGYVSALILKTRYPMYDVSIIKSDKIGIIGVGEGSTEHWKDFIDFVGIDFKDLIKETDATYKGGIMFEGWTKDNYAHNIGPICDVVNVGQETISLMYQILEGGHQYSTNMRELYENKIPLNYSDDEVLFNQFHFNAFKLNEFLNKVSLEKGINIIIDEIEEVEIDETGITGLIGNNQNYKSDFYIDSTGFKRILIGKLGAKWESYSKYLKVNEAIAFPTGDTDEYPMYTLSRAMDYGWLWRTPTYGRWGNGYIFDNNYINAEQAQKEVEEYLGHEIDVFKSIKFNPGKIDKTWIKNCVAVGLSASFVEPLEASAISTSINQIFLFMHYFDNYTDYDIIDYNKKVNVILDNIRDFICLHYITDRNDTEFWKSLKNVDIPPSLSENLRKWSTRLPIKEDFQGTEYMLFWEKNYTQVMAGLGLIDKNIISKKHEMVFEPHRNAIKEEVNKFLDTEEMDLKRYLTHKNYLTLIRETNYD